MHSAIYGEYIKSCAGRSGGKRLRCGRGVNGYHNGAKTAKEQKQPNCGCGSAAGNGLCKSDMGAGELIKVL